MLAEGDRVNFWWAIFFLAVITIGPALMIYVEIRDAFARRRWRQRSEEVRAKLARERGLM